MWVPITTSNKFREQLCSYTYYCKNFIIKKKLVYVIKGVINVIPPPPYTLPLSSDALFWFAGGMPKSSSAPPQHDIA